MDDYGFKTYPVAKVINLLKERDNLAAEVERLTNDLATDRFHIIELRGKLDKAESALSPAATEPVARFGFGNLLVDTGSHYGTPAVFIGPSPEAGPIGENARPEHKLPTDRLVPGEFFMTFPTEEQAARVADALVNTPVTEPVAWQWRMNHPDAEWSQGLRMDLYEEALVGMEKRLLYAAPSSPVTAEVERLKTEIEQTNQSWNHTSNMLGAALSRATQAEAERDAALVRAGAAATDMRERASKVKQRYSNSWGDVEYLPLKDQVQREILALPIDPDAQAALDKLIADARAEEARACADIVGKSLGRTVTHIQKAILARANQIVENK